MFIRAARNAAVLFVFAVAVVLTYLWGSEFYRWRQAVDYQSWKSAREQCLIAISDFAQWPASYTGRVQDCIDGKYLDLGDFDGIAGADALRLPSPELTIL